MRWPLLFDMLCAPSTVDIVRRRRVHRVALFARQAQGMRDGTTAGPRVCGRGLGMSIGVYGLR